MIAVDRLGADNTCIVSMCAVVPFRKATTQDWIRSSVALRCKYRPLVLLCVIKASNDKASWVAPSRCNRSACRRRICVCPSAATHSSNKNSATLASKVSNRAAGNRQFGREPRLRWHVGYVWACQTTQDSVVCREGAIPLLALGDSVVRAQLQDAPVCNDGDGHHREQFYQQNGRQVVVSTGWWRGGCVTWRWCYCG